MRHRLVPLIGIALVTSLTLAAPATAYIEIYRPDVFVKHNVGEGIHDATGTGQIKQIKVRKGGMKSLPFWNRNDGNTTDTFTYWGCSGKGPFKVTWLDWADADVTAATTAGTYTTPPLPSGWSEGMLTLKIKTKATAASGRHLLCTVLATSAGNNEQDRAGYRIVVR